MAKALQVGSIEHALQELSDKYLGEREEKDEQSNVGPTSEEFEALAKAAAEVAAKVRAQWVVAVKKAEQAAAETQLADQAVIKAKAEYPEYKAAAAAAAAEAS